MDVYVLLLKDGTCYGSTQPMNKKEADLATIQALDCGYSVSAICLNKLFSAKKYIPYVVKPLEIEFPEE